LSDLFGKTVVAAGRA